MPAWLSAGVLAFAVLVLAIMQIGSAIVLLPVIIWIWATKDFWPWLLLTIYLLVVGLADNVLKPMLMGRGLSTPTLVIFIGVAGRNDCARHRRPVRRTHHPRGGLGT